MVRVRARGFWEILGFRGLGLGLGFLHVVIAENSRTLCLTWNPGLKKPKSPILE